jgi:hypothetical protein
VQPATDALLQKSQKAIKESLEGNMQIMKRVGVIGLWILLVLTTAVVTAAIKQRFGDGPNRVFSGGELVSGELYQGPEPDWSFVNDVDTLELQLLDPVQSRRIWTASDDGKIYVWSGYMNSTMGKLWKSWPAQAERDGRAVLRINGIRYERQLVRVTSGEGLEALTATMNEKYSSRATPAAIDSGDVWMFEAQPRGIVGETP